jgi:hypothetical protein
MELGGEQDPRDLRTHGMSGAVFYPGLHDNQHAIGDAHADNMVIGKDGGGVIHIKPNGEIHLYEENAAEPVALGTKTKTELDTLKTDINNLKTIFSTWVVVPKDGGAALKTAAAAWYGSPVVINPVAASKVKAT